MEEEHSKGEGHSDDDDDEHSKGKGGNSEEKGDHSKGKGDNSKGKGDHHKGKGTPSDEFCPCSKGEIRHDEQQDCPSCASTHCASKSTCVMTRAPPNTESHCICKPACVPIIIQ